MFFSSYGGFMHKLIERHYVESATAGQMLEEYLCEFGKEVCMDAPSETVFANYFNSGLEYIKNFKPLPYRPLAIERRIEFKIDGIPFVGILDYLGEDGEGLVIVDNKSRNLKPRSGRAKPTAYDAELDEYMMQLYLYSAAVEYEYGRFPSSLCFNCFRENILIKERFDESAYVSAKSWLADSVSMITNETDFRPDMEYFKCRYLCEMQDECEFYQLNRG